VSQEGPFYGQETARQPVQPVQPTAVPQPAVAAAPAAVVREMTPEEKEFMDALTRLFTSAQEFGLALAAIESDLNSLPQDVREALELGREVAKAVKNFQRIVRRRLEGRVAAR
jgi:hypothetical protein